VGCPGRPVHRTARLRGEFDQQWEKAAAELQPRVETPSRTSRG
jgi:hypothetical protein